MSNQDLCDRAPSGSVVQSEIVMGKSRLLSNHYVLTCQQEPSSQQVLELFGQALMFGTNKSLEITQRADSFVLIYSGYGARRSNNWHVHVVIVRNRLEKAWTYFVLFGKNLLQAFGVRSDQRLWA